MSLLRPCRPARWTPALVLALALLAGCQDHPAAPAPVHADRFEATVPEALDLLSSRIEGLVDEGALNGGQGSALLQKVRNVQRHFEAGRTGPALAAIDALIVQIEAFVAGGVLTEEQGQMLLAAAQAARAAIDPPALEFRGSTVAAGSQHACALDDAGQPWCWGETSSGPSTTPAAVPTSPALETLTAGSSFTCGLDSAGAAWCWGSNHFGSLGVGDPALEFSEAPLRVHAPEPFVELDAGEFSICGLAASGSAFCWGSNSEGELGNTAAESCSATTCASAPTATAGNLTFESIDLGAFHTCGVGTDGATYCWGGDTFGTDGDGIGGNGGPTPRIPDTDIQFSDLTAGTAHTCSLEESGAAYCWGTDLLGSLGTGTQVTAPTPEPLAGDHAFTRIEASDANSFLTMTCAIDVDEAAWCWGSNEFGELGTEQPVDPECADLPGLGTIPCSAVPVPVSGGHAWSEISPGMNYVCGRTTSDEIYCWGRNATGTLGDGTTTDRPQPNLVVTP